MPDIQVGRETYIMISDEGPALYPHPSLFPSPDLFPSNAERIGNIVEGTMDLDELLCDGELKFGQMCATKFEVTVYDTGDVGGKYLSVYQEDAGIFSQVFTGIVDSAKLDRLGTDRQIVAYDYAYNKSRINIASWWDNFWLTRESATLKQLRDSLLSFAGIIYEDVELINDNITVTKTVNISSMAFTEMLRMICELSCCFPHFNRDGVMEFIMLEVDSEPTLLDGLYEGENSTFQDYTTQNYTGIQFYGNSSDLQYVEGTSVNPYTIQENILLYNRTNEDLHTIGANMLEYIRYISYRPSSIKMIVSDWQYKLGDKVGTERGDFFILHQAFNGMQLIEQTIEQSGSETQDEVSVETNISDLLSDAEIDGIGEDIDDINEEIDDINENVGNLEIHLNRTDEGIEAEVRRAEGEEARIELKVDEFRSEIAGSQKEWDTTGYNVTEFGYDSPTTEGYEPSEYTGKYYLNQTNGYLYYSNGSSWNLIKYCQTIQVALQSQITQTASEISLKVSKGDVSSQLSVESGQITLSSGRLVINSGNFQVNSSGYMTCYGANINGNVNIPEGSQFKMEGDTIMEPISIGYGVGVNCNGQWQFDTITVNGKTPILSGDSVSYADRAGSADYATSSQNASYAGYANRLGDSIDYVQISSNDNLIPSSSDVACGTSSNPFKSGYAVGNWTSSDKKEKTHIRYLEDDDRIESFVMGLKPVEYGRKDDTLETCHFGFYAQEVYENAKKFDIRTDFMNVFFKDTEDTVCQNPDMYKDEHLRWWLNYPALIAPLVSMVQKQHNKIEELENRIKILEEER